MTLIKQKSALIRFFLTDSSHQNTEITIRVGACIAVRTQKAFYIYACARVCVRRGTAAVRIVANNHKVADFWAFYTKSESDSAKNPNHRLRGQIKKRKKSKKFKIKKLRIFKGLGMLFVAF